MQYHLISHLQPFHQQTLLCRGIQLFDLFRKLADAGLSLDGPLGRSAERLCRRQDVDEGF